ncbi:MAG TPA: hypothetical protein VJH06_02675 [Candidatus Paceibacterota bacterium]
MDTTAQFPKIAFRIIKEQELIIGPLAWDEARKVQGIQILNQKNGEINLDSGNQKNIIDRLVAQYERIFGEASHVVCHDAVQDLIAEMPPEEIPASLK